MDEDDYASIVNQVKNAEFHSEIERRLKELDERHKAEQELATAKTKQDYIIQLNQKQQELRDKNAAIEQIKYAAKTQMDMIRGEKDAEIARLKDQLANIESQKKGELALALSEKDKTITRLNADIAQNANKLELALMEERNKAQQLVQDKDVEILKLQSAAQQMKNEAKIHEEALEKRHQEELRMKQEQIDYYKDLKTKLSTKMVGETLEQHCSIQFEQYIRPLMPNAYFDKDNDAADGTKGDFIFRDSDELIEEILLAGVELVDVTVKTCTTA